MVSRTADLLIPRSAVRHLRRWHLKCNSRDQTVSGFAAGSRSFVEGSQDSDPRVVRGCLVREQPGPARGSTKGQNAGRAQPLMSAAGREALIPFLLVVAVLLILP